MILFQMIIQVTVGAMAYLFPQLGFNGLGIGIMAIAGDPIWDTAGDRACGPKECFCCRAVALLTQLDIDQVPITIAA